MMDKFKLALDALNSANKKLKDGGGMKKTTLLKMLLSQTGVAWIVEVSDVEQVVKFFYKEIFFTRNMWASSSWYFQCVHQLGKILWCIWKVHTNHMYLVFFTWDHDTNLTKVYSFWIGIMSFKENDWFFLKLLTLSLVQWNSISQHLVGALSKLNVLANTFSYGIIVKVGFFF